jgi:hypothetical protein
VIGATFVAVLIYGTLTVSVPPRVETGRPNRIPVANFQAASPAQKNNPNHAGQKGKRNMGEWLRAHKDLPLDQQLKELEKEPAYQRLSPQKQTAYREWVQRFNGLPPEKQEQTLKNIDFLAKLTPQQRQQLRDTNHQIQGLPAERRIAVHKAVRHLRQMPPDQRKQVLQSDRFRSTFSDQEQKLIAQLTELPDSGQNAQTK